MSVFPGFSIGITCPSLNSSDRSPVCNDSFNKIAMVLAIFFAATLRSVELISFGPVAFDGLRSFNRFSTSQRLTTLNSHWDRSALGPQGHSRVSIPGHVRRF